MEKFGINKAIRILRLRSYAKKAKEGRLYDIACSVVLSKLRKVKEYEKAEERGELVRLPCAIGDTVYILAECENIPTKLDGTLYGENGGPGTATGYYCPYENNCPFDDDDFEGCESCKGKTAVFEDTVEKVMILDYAIHTFFENCVVSGVFGSDVFLSRDEAEKALEKRKEEERNDLD